ncbi:MAG TPA: hypothetical protein VN031_00765 [Candidatus Microsaccharimonas sp.]|nr:hypothetical protein [Candidatus Microsaccharimonas sp.]
MAEPEAINVRDVTVTRLYRVVYEGDNEIYNGLVNHNIEESVEITHDPDKQFLVAAATEHAAFDIKNAIMEHQARTLFTRILGPVLLALPMLESDNGGLLDKIALSTVGTAVIIAGEKLRVERKRQDAKLWQGKLATRLNAMSDQKIELDKALNPDKYVHPENKLF